MPRNRNRNRNRNKNKGKGNKPRRAPFSIKKKIEKKTSSKTKTRTSLAKKQKKELERAARELNLIPRNINHPDKKQVIENQNNNLVLAQNNNILNANQNQNIFENNNGVNTKRMISSKMYSSKSKNGKEEVVVDILSGITKNKKSRVLRHFKVSKKGKTQYSTVLAKSNGKNIKVLESLHNGEQEKLRKFMLTNPEELKEVFNVQSTKIKGNNVLKSFHLNKGEKQKQTNNNGNTKPIAEKLSNFKFEKKTKQKFNTMRKALRNSIQSLMKPRPVEKKQDKKNKNQKKTRKRNRGKKK